MIHWFAFKMSTKKIKRPNMKFPFGRKCVYYSPFSFRLMKGVDNKTGNRLREEVEMEGKRVHEGRKGDQWPSYKISMRALHLFPPCSYSPGRSDCHPADTRSFHFQAWLIHYKAIWGPRMLLFSPESIKNTNCWLSCLEFNEDLPFL